MKKLALLVLLAIVLSTVMTAAIPTKISRLTILNKSGEEVYMKLTGSLATEAFYYFTVPAGTRDEPVVKVFTVMQDAYARETWMCGNKTSGQLIVSSNTRLTFTPCDQAFEASAKNIVGEPTMEKVVAYSYLETIPQCDFSWSNAYLYDGYWNYACMRVAWKVSEYKRPVEGACMWRYQY